MANPDIVKMRHNALPEEYFPLLNLHRKIIESLHFNFNDNQVMMAELTGNALALVAAKFKCEQCGSPTKLTIHHMINKSQKPLSSILKFVPQRHYFDIPMSETNAALRIAKKVKKNDSNKLRKRKKL